MGSTGLSGGTHVRVIFLRRHVLDDLVPLRGSVEDGAGLGCRRVRPVYQRLQRAVRIRRTGDLRYPAGQVGSANHRFDIRRHDGGRRPAGATCHHGRIRAGQVPAFGVCRMHVFRTWQRDSGHGRDAVHCQMVPRRADGAGHGPAAGHCPPRHGRGPGLGAAPCRGECRPCLQPGRDGPSGRLRYRADGRRPYPLGILRGA